ncbi:hypothetical protein ACDA63_07080 [Uliginosibacterium sp. sgz301328]|uniref:DUF7940 domain-containing protein n=1 Tax=Uliginosibacterium sp. sgz301328 TaxID=3243764 RepID=UPI00359CD613
MIELVEEARQWWRLWSVRILGLILLFPDIYNGVAALGWVEQLPAPAMWSVRALAAAGIAARIVKQRGLNAS